MFNAAQSGRERDTGGPRGPKSVRAAARTAQKLPPPICLNQSNQSATIGQRRVKTAGKVGGVDVRS